MGSLASRSNATNTKSSRFHAQQPSHIKNAHSRTSQPSTSPVVTQLVFFWLGLPSMFLRTTRCLRNDWAESSNSLASPGRIATLCFLRQSGYASFSGRHSVVAGLGCSKGHHGHLLCSWKNYCQWCFVVRRGSARWCPSNVSSINIAGHIALSWLALHCNLLTWSLFHF